MREIEREITYNYDYDDVLDDDYICIFVLIK